MKNWHCVQNCGACCHLEPAERPDLENYLTEEELELYMTMVGTGGWCINFDHDQRTCRIYEQRPHFCRVQPDIFARMYGVEEEEFDDFSIDCCRQQISGVYGARSIELKRYNQSIET